MKTDTNGGASAGDDLEKRLSGRFTAELEGAERDYPALREKLVGSVPAARGAPRAWPKIALPITSAAVLAVAVLAALGLLLGPGTSPSVAPGPAASSGVVLGADGIPTQIDGEHVYRVTDQAEWQNLSGSFLLGAHVVSYTPPCPMRMPSLPPQDLALAGGCTDPGFVPVALMSSAGSDPYAGTPLLVAEQGADALVGWAGGPAVVIRVHTHDPAAAGCSAEQKAACEAAVVVESVVWPAVPTQIAGERVYRAADQDSFPTSGSFLLGGLVTMPDFIPPCPALQSLTTAEADLIPYCYWEAIDSIHVAPKVDALAELRDRIVVARVHINDAEAASCPVSIQAQCKAAVVVEDVIWTGGAVSSSPAPNPTPVQTTPNSASSEAVGPVGTDQIGLDGVPTTLNGATVYRAANLPSSPIFLLGGRLTRDTACAAPATPLANPPACGYWLVDGMKVGTIVDLPESLLGQPVVAQVEVGRALAVCPGGSCTKSTIVVMALVWPEAGVATPPAPPSPLMP
jgi:hypothetical protein